MALEGIQMVCSHDMVTDRRFIRPQIFVLSSLIKCKRLVLKFAAHAHCLCNTSELMPMVLAADAGMQKPYGYGYVMSLNQCH